VLEQRLSRRQQMVWHPLRLKKLGGAMDALSHG
jgi:hypothetical protein